MASKFLTGADVAPLFPGTWMMPIAPQIEAMYGDPRLADIPDRDPDDPWAHAAVYYPLPPINPPKNTESRFVVLKSFTSALDYQCDPFKESDWLNRPGFFQQRQETWGGSASVLCLRNRSGAESCAHRRSLQSSHPVGAAALFWPPHER